MKNATEHLKSADLTTQALEMRVFLLSCHFCGVTSVTMCDSPTPVPVPFLSSRILDLREIFIP